MSTRREAGTRCPCSTDARTRSRAGFTLVEAMASIAVVSLLMALLAGAISGARSHAREIECRTVLRSVGQGIFSHANDNGGYWPNAFADRMDETYQFFTGSVGNSWKNSYWSQVRSWATALIGSYWDAGDPAAI